MNHAGPKVFPVGKYMKDELLTRSWTQADLAYVMGRKASEISSLMVGRRQLSPVKKNIVICCYRCNALKGDASPSEMINIATIAANLIRTRKLKPEEQIRIPFGRKV